MAEQGIYWERGKWRKWCTIVSKFKYVVVPSTTKYSVSHVPGGSEDDIRYIELGIVVLPTLELIFRSNTTS
jgi:hypothetical protein